jgi:hypothetical protein
VQSDGSDKGADPTLAVVRLNAQAVLRDVLVVEDHGFRHVAISQTVVGKKKKSRKGAKEVNSRDTLSDGGMSLWDDALYHGRSSKARPALLIPAVHTPERPLQSKRERP